MCSSDSLSPATPAREMMWSDGRAELKTSFASASKATSSDQNIPPILVNGGGGGAAQEGLGSTDSSAPRSKLGRAAISIFVLAALWTVLAGGSAESWIFGTPAVLLATALVFTHEPAPRWWLSPLGTLRFMVWFVVQSVRGAIDVAGRALSWNLPIQPGCCRWRTRLPQGAPRLVFANAVTLLPGTLTAEIEGDLLVVHMLDTRADLDDDLGALQERVAALFALPAIPRAASAAAG